MLWSEQFLPYQYQIYTIFNLGGFSKVDIEVVKGNQG